MHTHVHAHTHAHTHTHTCAIYTCAYISICLYSHVRTCLHAYVPLHLSEQKGLAGLELKAHEMLSDFKTKKRKPAIWPFQVARSWSKRADWRLRRATQSGFLANNFFPSAITRPTFFAPTRTAKILCDPPTPPPPPRKIVARVEMREKLLGAPPRPRQVLDVF
jgi:hypothetical protein